jgi:hypothetical protein
MSCRIRSAEDQYLEAQVFVSPDSAPSSAKMFQLLFLSIDILFVGVSRFTADESNVRSSRLPDPYSCL